MFLSTVLIYYFSKYIFTLFLYIFSIGEQIKLLLLLLLFLLLLLLLSSLLLSLLLLLLLLLTVYFCWHNTASQNTTNSF